MVLEPEPGKAIKVLRPCHPLECIWVSKDPASIATMISYMRSEGVGSSLVAPKLPKGIQRRGQKFVVKYIKEDGKHGWKTLNTLDAAVAFKQQTVEAPDARDAEELVEAEDGRAADKPEAEDEPARLKMSL